MEFYWADTNVEREKSYLHEIGRPKWGQPNEDIINYHTHEWTNMLSALPVSAYNSISQGAIERCQQKHDNSFNSHTPMAKSSNTQKKKKTIAAHVLSPIIYPWQTHHGKVFSIFCRFASFLSLNFVLASFFMISLLTNPIYIFNHVQYSESAEKTVRVPIFVLKSGVNKMVGLSMFAGSQNDKMP